MTVEKVGQPVISGFRVQKILQQIRHFVDIDDL
jgi:hypothetical protein